MASADPKGPGKWIMRWRAVDPATGRKEQRTKIFKGTHADAVRRANELEAQQRREPVQSTRGLTLAAFLQDWQAWREAAGNVSIKTAYRDAQYAKVISALIGARPLAGITPRDLDQLTAALRQRKYAGSTVHNTWGCARKALRQARRWHLITGAPWEDAATPPIALNSPSPPSVAETQRLADLLAADQPIAAVLVHALLATGMRKSEALALTWDDIDLDRGAITVSKSLWEAGTKYGLKLQPKNAASRRSVALAADCIGRLKAHKAWIRERQLESGRTWNPDDLVFPAFHGGLWRPSRATAIVAAVARKHGLPTGLHCRRHTHAVLLLERQVPIKVVAGRLGHADPSLTLKVYQHVTEQAAQLAIQALDRGLPYASSQPADAVSVSSDGAEFVHQRVHQSGGKGNKPD
jgi:integrase